jgi:heme exporter protein C
MTASLLPTLEPLLTSNVGAGLVLVAYLAGVILGPRLRPGWEHAYGVLGLGLLVFGQVLGLVVAPPDAMMGDVGRILYVHVPSAWLTMVWFTAAFVAAAAFLFVGRKGFDLFVEAAVEVGIVLSILLQVTGMLFAKPTWGIYWDWDPRLVSATVMMLAFMGVQTLRATLDDPDRRATWTSVATILAYTSVAVTYESVRIWRSIHQMQSSPATVAKPMVAVLRLNAWAFLFLTTWMVVRRYRIAATRARAEEAPPLPDEVTA